MTADSLRAMMPALAHKFYFNYGGQGPLPTPSLEAITASWRTIQELGPFSSAVWPWISSETNGLRQRLARLCGVSAQRLAFTENVTTGCVLPLWGLPWEEGDELLISDCEHPGVVAACAELARRERLGVTRLAVRERSCRSSAAGLEDAVLEALERSLRPRTRLVVLSHLLWNTGAVMPIPAVARRLAGHPRHPWLLVDAAQSVGSLPVAEAASSADIYAFTGHKWCCGPEGLGGVAVSERVLEAAAPTLIGWRSLSDEGAPGAGFHRDARRFEVATSCIPLFAGLARSLALLDAEGSEAERLEMIRERSVPLWRRLAALSGVEPLLQSEPAAGLVSFRLTGTAAEHTDLDGIIGRLGAQGFCLRSLADPPCLRACTHVTTTQEEVEKLLQALETLIQDSADRSALR